MYSIFNCSKCQIYYNTGKKTLKQIKEELGCTHIINGYLFNMSTFKPNPWLVLNGKVVSRDQYKDWGLEIKDGKPFFSINRETNFISGIPILVNGNSVYRNLTSDVKRSTYRTAIGWTKEGKVILYCVASKLSREQLQERLLCLGAYNALMLDGGGSTQGIFPEGTVSSTRKVATVLAFWDEKLINKENSDMYSVNIYNSETEGTIKVATNFKVKEFKSKDSKIVLIHHSLPVALQMVREKLGKPINLTNAYRTEAHNKSVGGASNSYHLYGMAADIYVSGMDATSLAKVIDNLFPTTFCVIAYPKKGIVHFDVRAKKYRATNSGKEVAVEHF